MLETVRLLGHRNQSKVSTPAWFAALAAVSINGLSIAMKPCHRHSRIHACSHTHVHAHTNS
uniref:Uncharacterized protein n=1 Tax=Anguilla anguilla TaxID=7936 RepID=A0A0E9WES5_ANGAN